MGNCASNCLQVLADEVIEPYLKPRHSNTESSSPKSIIHKALPSMYEVHRVIKVYDGDTLTLEDKKRVRLLGIDTPEIKPKQPYAEDAKELLTNYCLDQSVYFSYEGDKTDRYGRILAWVWVKRDGGYLNINEEQVASGFATIYNPGKIAFKNQNQLFAYQKSAREKRYGQFAEFTNSKVLKTKNGRCYHRDKSCTYLTKSKHLIPILKSDALDKGLSPCRGCYL